MNKMEKKGIYFYCDDVSNQYSSWPSPVVIISDGPYGVSGFDGDPHTHKDLAAWYEPHIAEWSRRSTAQTTLWFWNTEIGWATVHPVLEKYGWEYKTCNVWDKGRSHIAGNVNTKSLSQFPVVSEVCVHYVKKPEFVIRDQKMTMQQWLRYEWDRTGIPFSKTNEACGVKNAATRKYFTKCHLWYMPPADMFEMLVSYANTHGLDSGKPYFSIDNSRSLTKEEWSRYRAKFYCPFGQTNVWTLPQLKGDERIKKGCKSVHLNQKPLALVEQIISASSDFGDTIWDPFAGLATTAIASLSLGRQCYTAEINEDVFSAAYERIENELNKPSQLCFQDISVCSLAK